MGTVSRVHTFASGAILTAAQLNNEFDNLLTSSAINGGLDATNLGVTAGQATASKALVVDASRNLADATGSNRINNLALSGTFESTGAITASAGITSGGNIVSDTDSTDDLGTTGVRWANLFVDDVTVTNNVTIGGTLTLTGGITLNGNTTIGDSSADTLTVNSTITSNLIFTDNTYDIGASGATRPRDLFLSRNAVMGGTLGVTGLITATGGVSGALTGNVTGNLSGNVTGGTISGTTGTFSGNVTISKDAPQLIMTDSGVGGGTSDIIIDAIGSNHGFYFRADGATNHVILESNGDFKVDASVLFVDASADRVGINTSSPQAPLNAVSAYSSATTTTSLKLATVGGYDSGSGTSIDFGQDQSNYSTWLTGKIASPRTGTNWGGSLVFYTNDNSAATGIVERLRLNHDGNMGLGVTPSAWSGRRALEIEGASTGYVTSPNGPIAIGSNIYYNGGDKFVGNGYAPLYALSSGNHIWYTSNNNTSGAGAAVTLTQAMTLTSAGLLGIGTSSPSYPLEVAAGTGTTGLMVGGSAGQVELQGDGQVYGYQKLDVTSAGLQIKGFSDGGGAKTEQARLWLTQAATGASGGEIRFYTNNGSAVYERARITSTGSAIFNATSADGASVVISNSIASTYGLSIYDDANSGWIQRFYDNSAVISGSITRSGTSVAYNTSSDYRLKENVVGITDGITRIKSLKPSRFNFIENADRTVDGFVAHEVSDIVPEAISGAKDAVDDEGNPQYQGIDQSKLVPLLTAALQEAITKIETLETKVAALEAA
jgi:hypothetical protein